MKCLLRNAVTGTRVYCVTIARRSYYIVLDTKDGYVCSFDCFDAAYGYANGARVNDK